MANYRIFKDGEEVNTIVAGPDFVEDYCTENGFTFEEVVEPEPEEPTEPTPTLSERVETLEATSAEMTEALDLLLSGAIE